MELVVRTAASVAAAVVVAYETKEGRTVGDMTPNRMFLVLVLLALAFD